MATLYNGNNILSGPGTLFAAPLGTSEPTACTGDWPTGWLAIGYTEQGSQFNLKPTVNPITPEEEYWPSRNVVTGYEGHVIFAMLEPTLQNWQLALNQGIGTSAMTSTVTTLTDGGKRIAMGDIGTEIRVMLGWDSYDKGTAAVAGTPVGPNQGRLIIPQALQVGQVQTAHRKGAHPQSVGVDFMIEKKDAFTDPFAIFVPASLV